MNYAPEDIQLISIPLTAKDRQIAQTFADQQPNAEKQEQVYQNTLAVLATHRYFTMLGIPSDLEASDCWNASKRQTQDIADLYVPQMRSRVECRSIEPGDDRCYIPREVWKNRAGYIVVELDNNGREGMIRGFVPEVSVEQMPLSYLRSLDSFFDQVACGSVERLSGWIVGHVSPGWLPLQDLPKSPVMIFGASPDAAEPNDRLEREIANLYRSDSSLTYLPANQLNISPLDALATFINQTQDDRLRWRAAELLHRLSPQDPLAATMRAEDLGLYLAGQTVALLVGIVMKPDGKALVMTRVYPMGDLAVLSPGLKLSGITQAGQVFFEVQSRQSDDYIQFLFTGDLGDEFMLRVSFNTASVTENFAI